MKSVLELTVAHAFAVTYDLLDKTLDLETGQWLFVSCKATKRKNVQILDIRPEPGSSFVNSSSEPFNEEQELEYGRFINWLDHFGLPMYRIHCSGHAMPDEIKELMIKIAYRLHDLV